MISILIFTFYIINQRCTIILYQIRLLFLIFEIKYCLMEVLEQPGGGTPALSINIFYCNITCTCVQWGRATSSLNISYGPSPTIYQQLNTITWQWRNILASEIFIPGKDKWYALSAIMTVQANLGMILMFRFHVQLQNRKLCCISSKWWMFLIQ